MVKELLINELLVGLIKLSEFVLALRVSVCDVVSEDQSSFCYYKIRGFNPSS